MSQTIDTRIALYINEIQQQVRKQGLYPAGHYYSPIPSEDEVVAYINSRKPPPSTIPGVELNKHSQSVLLNEYAQFYADLPFPDSPRADRRYYYANDWFNSADAIFLYSFLRKNKPKRIIEIGSGFSSAAILDTVDNCFSQRPEITFVEPHPERLHSLLRGCDRDEVRIVEKRVQDTPSEIFSSLQGGDLLFIDSSHVVKCASDVHLLMFEILPFLPSGVFVHFHDVFYPFDYPSDWLKEGRYWNENYLLRAFLSYNSEWNIYFFNTYVDLVFGAVIKEKMPLCATNAGSSLYIQRR